MVPLTFLLWDDFFLIIYLVEHFVTSQEQNDVMASPHSSSGVPGGKP